MDNFPEDAKKDFLEVVKKRKNNHFKKRYTLVSREPLSISGEK